MKTIFNNRVKSIATAVTIALAVASSSCASDANVTAVGAEQEGALSLSLTLRSAADVSSATTRAADTDTFLANSKLKIFDASNTLVRLYEPASEMPAVIYLTEGNYSAQVSVTGDTATFDSNQRSFAGDESFTISATNQADVDIICPMTNSVLEVIFDETIYELYAEPSVTIYAEGYESSGATLTFTEQASTGYFVVPEGVTTLKWSFTAQRLIGSGEATFEGSFDAPAAREKLIKTFKYNGQVDATTTYVSVDTSEDIWDDELIFSPQPTVVGSDFDIDESQLVNGSDFIFNVKSINPMSSLSVYINGETVTPLSNAASVDVSSKGIKYDVTDSTNGILTISSSAFDGYTTGGAKSVKISLNSSGSVGEEEPTFIVPGVEKMGNIDLWFNNATLSGSVTSTSHSSVHFEYRESSDSNWTSIATTTSDNINYTAQLEPTWETLKNDDKSQDVYKQLTGIQPNKSYETRLVVDGVALDRTVTTTTTATVPTIPYGEMNDSSLPCFTTSGSSSSTTWASGNNTFTKSLCSHGTYANESVAILDATYMFVLASGNIVYGIFEMDGMSGSVSFGQSFTWSARPRTLSVRYSASIGTVDNTSSSVPSLEKGDSDISRIFFAIVDWDKRHVVSAGTGATSGTWDPAKETSTSEGKIIGYASTYITKSNSAYITEELPIYYYDTDIKPSKTYTIVISASTSAYGDYKAGSSDSKMYVDYFRLGY